MVNVKNVQMGLGERMIENVKQAVIVILIKSWVQMDNVKIVHSLQEDKTWDNVHLINAHQIRFFYLMANATIVLKS